MAGPRCVILWKRVHLRYTSLRRGAQLRYALQPLANGQAVAAGVALTLVDDPLALRVMAASVPPASLRARLNAEADMDLARAKSGLWFLDVVAQVDPAAKGVGGAVASASYGCARSTARVNSAHRRAGVLLVPLRLRKGTRWLGSR